MREVQFVLEPEIIPTPLPPARNNRRPIRPLLPKQSVHYDSSDSNTDTDDDVAYSYPPSLRFPHYQSTSDSSLSPSPPSHRRPIRAQLPQQHDLSDDFSDSDDDESVSASLPILPLLQHFPSKSSLSSRATTSSFYSSSSTSSLSTLSTTATFFSDYSPIRQEQYRPSQVGQVYNNGPYRQSPAESGRSLTRDHVVPDRSQSHPPQATQHISDATTSRVPVNRRYVNIDDMSNSYDDLPFDETTDSERAEANQDLNVAPGIPAEPIFKAPLPPAPTTIPEHKAVFRMDQSYFDSTSYLATFDSTCSSSEPMSSNPPWLNQLLRRDYPKSFFAPPSMSRPVCPPPASVPRTTASRVTAILSVSEQAEYEQKKIKTTFDFESMLSAIKTPRRCNASASSDEGFATVSSDSFGTDEEFWACLAEGPKEEKSKNDKNKEFIAQIPVFNKQNAPLLKISALSAMMNGEIPQNTKPTTAPVKKNFSIKSKIPKISSGFGKKRVIMTSTPRSSFGFRMNVSANSTIALKEQSEKADTAARSAVAMFFQSKKWNFGKKSGSRVSSKDLRRRSPNSSDSGVSNSPKRGNARAGGRKMMSARAPRKNRITMDVQLSARKSSTARPPSQGPGENRGADQRLAKSAPRASRALTPKRSRIRASLATEAPIRIDPCPSTDRLLYVGKLLKDNNDLAAVQLVEPQGADDKSGKENDAPPTNMPSTPVKKVQEPRSPKIIFGSPPPLTNNGNGYFDLAAPCQDLIRRGMILSRPEDINPLDQTLEELMTPEMRLPPPLNPIWLVTRSSSTLGVTVQVPSVNEPASSNQQPDASKTQCSQKIETTAPKIDANPKTKDTADTRSLGIFRDIREAVVLHLYMRIGLIKSGKELRYSTAELDLMKPFHAQRIAFFQKEFEANKCIDVAVATKIAKELAARRIEATETKNVRICEAWKIFLAEYDDVLGPDFAYLSEFENHKDFEEMEKLMLFNCNYP